MARSRAGTLERAWRGRVADWNHHVFTAPAFGDVRAAVLAAAEPRGSDRVVDLGAGTGFITLPLAAEVAHVTAVDLAGEMLATLAQEAVEAGRHNITTVVADLAELTLPPASVDVVVSSYALHHLTDARKADLVHRSRQWLRPGGRLVIADMMFGRGNTARDRRIIRNKVATLARKGPGGLWRIAKNAARFGLRVGMERPAAPDFWLATLQAAGFESVGYRPVVAEAGLVHGRLP